MSTVVETIIENPVEPHSQGDTVRRRRTQG